MYLLLCFLGFVVFQFLAIYNGETGKLGFAIGYAILSIGFLISSWGQMIMKLIEKNKPPKSLT
jgi:hypothetical protein